MAGAKLKAQRATPASQPFPEVKVLVFDTFGTVVDWHGSVVREMADIAVQCAALTLETTQKLHAMSKNRDRLNELTEAVTRLESESDAIFDAGMKALFLEHRAGNAMEFIIGAEIYDHLEKVIDRFEDVANRVNGIMVEHL